MQISLSARNIEKRFGGVVALRDASLEVQSGEILALVGANGSGKSTLGKVITGVVAPDGGQLLLDGKEISFSSPQEAQKEKISAVYQDLSLVPYMTVEENIWLGHEPLSWTGLVRTREIRRRTGELIELFAGTVSSSLRPDSLVMDLSPDEKQIVEIMKAISRKPRLLILDEATASLDNQQVARLFELAGDWKRQGTAIIFISHRLYEIFNLVDRVTVLRNGESIASAGINEVSERELVRMMVEGGVVREGIERRVSYEHQDIHLELEDIHTPRLKGVSLQAYRGELLGLGGLRGQGQSSLLRTIFGASSFTGRIRLNGKDVNFNHPKEAVEAGIAFVPGERATEGLLYIRPILENLQIPSWQKYGILINMGDAREDAIRIAGQLNLVMASLDEPVSTLSGGNAQKVVLGKWLLRSPQLLLLDDPTKGVDVGTKNEIYRILSQLQAMGVTILMYSSDDDELLSLCSRILVLHDGRIEGELRGEELNRSALIAASLGAKGEEK